MDEPDRRAAQSAAAKAGHGGARHKARTEIITSLEKQRREAWVIRESIRDSSPTLVGMWLDAWGLAYSHGDPEHAKAKALAYMEQRMLTLDIAIAALTERGS